MVEILIITIMGYKNVGGYSKNVYLGCGIAMSLWPQGK